MPEGPQTPCKEGHYREDDSQVHAEVVRWRAVHAAMLPLVIVLTIKHAYLASWPAMARLAVVIGIDEAARAIGRAAACGVLDAPACGARADFGREQRQAPVVARHAKRREGRVPLADDGPSHRGRAALEAVLVRRCEERGGVAALVAQEEVSGTHGASGGAW